jgi:hypothetical protein
MSDINLHESNADGFLAFAQEDEGAIRFKACHVFGNFGQERFHRALELAKGGVKTSSQRRSLSADYRQEKWALEGSTLDDVKVDKNKKIESALRSTESGKLEIVVGLGGGNVVPCEFAFRRLHQQPLGFLMRLQVIGPAQKPGQRTLF